MSNKETQALQITFEGFANHKKYLFEEADHYRGKQG